MPKKKTNPEPIPQDVIDAIDTTPDEKMLEDLKQNHKRIMSVKKRQIGDTFFTIYSVVPENCTDEQFYASVEEKIKRLILNNVEKALRDEMNQVESTASST